MKKSSKKLIKIATPSVVSREKLMRDEPEEWCVLLGLMGFSAKAIAHEAGLSSAASVHYYLHKRGVKLSDYRNGKTKWARYIIKNTATLPVRNTVALDLRHRLTRLHE